MESGPRKRKPFESRGLRARVGVLFSFLLVCSAAGSPLLAQYPTTRPGAHDGTIEGEIVLGADNAAAPHRATVELFSRRLGVHEVRILSRGESFEFRGLRSAVYTVRVSCEDHQPVEQSVNLAGSLRAEVVRVRLELGEPFDSDTVKDGPQTVSVTRLSIHPKALEALEKAARSSKEGDHRKAIRLLLRATRYQPDLGEAYNNLAVSYFRLGEYERAIEAAQRAIAIDEEDGLAHSNLGMTLLAKGQRREAQDELTRALALRPGSQEIQLQLAALSQDLGDFPLAARLFLQVWESGNQPDALLLQAAGCYFRAGDIPRSEDLVDRFAALHPGDPRPAEIRRLLQASDQPRP